MTPFDMTLEVPPDAEFAPMVRDLALHGARQAGCDDSRAEAFGREVENAAREALGTEMAKGAAGTFVSVVVSHSGGPVEVTIGSGSRLRRLTLEV